MSGVAVLFEAYLSHWATATLASFLKESHILWTNHPNVFFQVITLRLTRHRKTR